MFNGKLKMAIGLILVLSVAGLAQNIWRVSAGDGDLSRLQNSDLIAFLISEDGKDDLAPAATRTWDGGGTTNNWSEAANWSNDTVPTNSDSVVFDGTSTKNAAINVNVTVAAFNINAGYMGTISQGASNVTANGVFSQADGTFSGGGGMLDFNNNFTISGGTFTASSGTSNFASNFSVSSPAVFDANNGSVVFDGFSTSFDVTPNGALDFNNVEINETSSFSIPTGDTLRVNGTLTLTNGQISTPGSGVLEALGNVTINTTFDGGSAILLIGGNAARTITIPSPIALPPLTVNAPNVDITASGSGVVDFNSRTIIQNVNSFTNNASQFVFGSSDQYEQSGGTFIVGIGNITFGSLFTQSGGTFTGSSSTLQFGNVFTLSGGTFTASSGNTNFVQSLTISGTGVFQHNNGTVRFIGTDGTADLLNSEDFNNVEVDVTSARGLGSDDIMRIRGNLTLTNGQLSTNFGNARFEAFGDVTISPTFAGGSGNLHYVGTNNQTYTNNGGNNPSSIFRVDKPSGILTAATSIILPSNTGMVINSGTLYLANGSNLTAGGAATGLLILANGRLVSDSSTTITLGGNMSNGGVVDLRGGAACPANDTILIRSSNGTQRSWTGAGANRLVNVDVQSMGGTGTKTVFNGTDSLGNNSSWVFDSGCPTGLSLTPAQVFVQSGQTFDFEATGGFAPYTFDFLTNNTGGTINASTGLYTAGAIAGANDTIRVTDAFGELDFAVVNTYGEATKLDFITQPTNTTAGQTISNVQVAVKDAGGRIVRNSTRGATLSISSNPGGGTLSGTTTRTAVDGVITFDNLSINRTGNFYILQAAAGGLTSDTSSTFNITAGAAAKLGFVAQPGDTDPGQPVLSASVEIQDALGNRVTTASNSIIMSIGTNPTGGVLSGTLTRNAINGFAFFNDLGINQPGTGYTLRAQSVSLTADESQPFNINNPFAVTNTNDSGPGSLRQAIIGANALAGTQTISFNIPGSGPHTIQPQSFLPLITQSVIIDGTTQPGFSGSPIIEIDGTNVGNNGFNVLTGSGGVTIRGLVINRFIGYGIRIDTGSGHTIQGNYIGTDVAGDIALGNAGGIFLANTSNNLIEDNVISNSTQAEGILILDGAESNTTSRVLGNRIGTNADGTLAMPNRTGILIQNKIRVKIGGDLPGEGNIIAHNLQFGVFVQSQSSLNPIRGNSIHSNGALGISLGGSSATFNDALDLDTGGNTLQNFPVITSALASGATTIISGSLSSEPSKNYILDFYSNDSCSPSGNGEGRTYLGSTQVSTDFTGLVGVSTNLPVSITAGSIITATATSLSPAGDPENTSEFSQCRESAAAIFSITGRILDLSGNPIPNSFVLVDGFRTSFNTDSNGNYTIRNLPGGRDYTLRPSARGTTFSPASRTLTSLSADQNGQDFTELDPDISISGQVTSVVAGTGFPLQNATIQLLGTTTGLVKTDANGRYNFSNLTSGGNYQVRVAKPGFDFPADTRNFANLTSDQTADFAGSLPSALAGRILSTSGQTISAMNPDGSSLTTIFNRPGFGNCLEPSFSRDGSRIAVICGSGLPIIPRLLILNFDGSILLLRNEFPFGEIVGQPKFSPDGTKISYVRRGRLTVLSDPVSTAETILVNGSVTDHGGWSADGAKLVFSKLGQIRTVPAAGGAEIQLTSGSTDRKPRYSPDGSKIAFIRRNPGSSSGRIALMNSDGTGLTVITTADTYREVVWSPDGSVLGFRRSDSPNYGIIALNGATQTPIGDITGPLDWGPTFAVNTTTASAVEVSAGAVQITFDSVTSGGQTTVIPIPPNSAGTAPDGFVIGTQAYEISTTAGVTAPITVCLTVQNAPTQTQFDRMSILHGEGGVLVDRTVSRNFATKQICATVSSLSPFVLAEQIDTNLASISGLILDDSGVPLSGAAVNLTGTEVRQTETNSDGSFKFVNLTPNGNYNVSPKQVGYLFDEYNTNFIDLTGEETVFFEGTLNNFSISGQITDGNGDPVENISIELDGSAQNSTETDVDGNYTFTDLPADGFYTITPFNSGNSFSPESAAVDALTNDFAGIDFQMFAPTAANVSVGGRVSTKTGRGILNAILRITDSNGRQRLARTNSFGYYRFDDVEAGQIYIISVTHKNHQFTNPTQVINVSDSITDLHFIVEK